MKGSIFVLMAKTFGVICVFGVIFFVWFGVFAQKTF